MLSLLVPSLILYGFLVLVGGVIGYVKAKSAYPGHRDHSNRAIVIAQFGAS